MSDLTKRVGSVKGIEATPAALLLLITALLLLLAVGAGFKRVLRERGGVLEHL